MYIAAHETYFTISTPISTSTPLWICCTHKKFCSTNLSHNHTKWIRRLNQLELEFQKNFNCFGFQSKIWNKSGAGFEIVGMNLIKNIWNRLKSSILIKIKSKSVRNCQIHIDFGRKDRKRQIKLTFLLISNFLIFIWHLSHLFLSFIQWLVKFNQK